MYTHQDTCIHSFRLQCISIAPLKVHYYSEALLSPDTARIGLLCRSFTPKLHRQLRVKDLPKVPMWVARAGFEPAIVSTKGAESTNEPPRPTDTRRRIVAYRLTKTHTGTRRSKAYLYLYLYVHVCGTW